MAESNPKIRKRVKVEQIVQSFKRDCKTFLIAFSNIKDSSYKEFVYLWMDRGMTLCSILHRTVEKITFFNEHYFEVAKELLFAENDDYTKIGALYLLYTLFNRQFELCGTLIKFNVNELKLYSEIVCKLYDEGYIDAKIIDRELVAKNAFEYVICNEEETEVKGEQKKNDKKGYEVREGDKKLFESFNSSVQDYKTYIEVLKKDEVTGLSDTFKSLNVDGQNIDKVNLFLAGSQSEILNSPLFPKEKKIPKEKKNEGKYDLLESRRLVKEKAMAVSTSGPKHLVSVIPVKPSEKLELKENVDERRHKGPKKGHYKQALGAHVESDDEAGRSSEEFSNLRSSELDMPNL